MKKEEINIYEFDPEKKDYVTRSACEKLLKEIKASMIRHGKIKVTIEKSS